MRIVQQYEKTSILDCNKNKKKKKKKKKKSKSETLPVSSSRWILAVDHNVRLGGKD